MIFSVVVTSSDEQRQKWINDAKRLCRAAFSSRPPSCDGVEKQTQYELSSGKRVMVEDASGVEGLLIRSGASHCLRVYDRNDDFIDYDIYHDDLAVSIEDDSLASFYSDGQNHWVDHSPQVLGLKKVKKVKKEENNE